MITSLKWTKLRQQESIHIFKIAKFILNITWHHIDLIHSTNSLPTCMMYDKKFHRVLLLSLFHIYWTQTAAEFVLVLWRTIWDFGVAGWCSWWPVVWILSGWTQWVVQRSTPRTKSSLTMFKHILKIIQWSIQAVYCPMSSQLFFFLYVINVYNFTKIFKHTYFFQ